MQLYRVLSCLSGYLLELELALQLFRKANNIQIMAWTLRILSNIYDNKGDYENAFRTVREALDIYTNSAYDSQNKTLSLYKWASSIKALAIMRWLPNTTQKHGRKTPQGHIRIPRTEHRVGELYVAMNKVDSARYFYRNAIFGSPTTINDRLLLGESFLLSNNPDSALAYLGPYIKKKMRA